MGITALNSAVELLKMRLTVEKDLKDHENISTLMDPAFDSAWFKDFVDIELKVRNFDLITVSCSRYTSDSFQIKERISSYKTCIESQLTTVTGLIEKCQEALANEKTSEEVKPAEEANEEVVEGDENKTEEKKDIAVDESKLAQLSEELKIAVETYMKAAASFHLDINHFYKAAVGENGTNNSSPTSPKKHDTKKSSTSKNSDEKSKKHDEEKNKKSEEKPKKAESGKKSGDSRKKNDEKPKEESKKTPEKKADPSEKKADASEKKVENPEKKSDKKISVKDKEPSKPTEAKNETKKPAEPKKEEKKEEVKEAAKETPKSKVEAKETKKSESATKKSENGNPPKKPAAAKPKK